MNPRVRTSTSSSPLKKIGQNKPLLIGLVVVFLLVGIFIVTQIFASSVQVFTTNPDYWRDRIGYCESGGRYDRIGPSGHTGKYQYDAGTWRSAVGPALAAQYPQAYLAPGSVQEMAFNNTFAARGTQPWNASYHCWIKGADVPGATDDSLSLPSASAQVQAVVTPPPNPFGITSGSYNVTITGRVTLNNQPLQGVVLNTCSGDRKVTTDADGRFSFVMPVNQSFCVQPVGGIPDGARLEHTNNNVDFEASPTYEAQRAGVDCYHSVWCLLSPAYTWDRSKDSGYNFFYIK